MVLYFHYQYDFQSCLGLLLAALKMSSSRDAQKFVPTISELSVCSPFKPPSASRVVFDTNDSDTDSLPVIRVIRSETSRQPKTVSPVTEIRKVPSTKQQAEATKSSAVVSKVPPFKPISQAKPVGSKLQSSNNPPSKTPWRPVGTATANVAAKAPPPPVVKCVIPPAKVDIGVGPDHSDLFSTGIEAGVQCSLPCPNCRWIPTESAEGTPALKTTRNGEKKRLMTKSNQPLVTELDESFDRSCRIQEDISYDDDFRQFSDEEKENFSHRHRLSVQPPVAKSAMNDSVSMDKRFLQNIMENLKKTLGNEDSQEEIHSRRQGKQNPQRRKEHVVSAPVESAPHRQIVPYDPNPTRQSLKPSRNAVGHEVAAVPSNSLSVHMNVLAEKYLSREELSRFGSSCNPNNIGFQQPPKTFTVAKKQTVSTFAEFSVFEVPSRIDAGGADAESLSFLSRNYVARNGVGRTSAAPKANFHQNDYTAQPDYQRHASQYYNEFPRRPDHQDLSTIEERSEFTNASNFRSSHPSCNCHDCRNGFT